MLRTRSVAMSEMGKKINDLRVFELRSELDKRGLDKTGLKPILVKRLLTALETEGVNPDTYFSEDQELVAPRAGTSAEQGVREIEVVDLEINSDDIKQENLISISQSIFDTEQDQEEDGFSIPAESLEREYKELEHNPSQDFQNHSGFQRINIMSDFQKDEEDHDALKLTIDEADRRFGMEDDEDVNEVDGDGYGDGDAPTEDEDMDGDACTNEPMDIQTGDGSRVGTSSGALVNGSEKERAGENLTEESQTAGGSQGNNSKPSTPQQSRKNSTASNDAKNTNGEEANTSSAADGTDSQRDAKAEGRVVIVTGFPIETRAMDIKKLFLPYGKIVGVKIISITNKVAALSRFAQVTMFRSEDAKESLKLEATRVLGQPIHVEIQQAINADGSVNSKAEEKAPEVRDKEKQKSNSETLRPAEAPQKPRIAEGIPKGVGSVAKRKESRTNLKSGETTSSLTKSKSNVSNEKDVKSGKSTSQNSKTAAVKPKSVSSPADGLDNISNTSDGKGSHSKKSGAPVPVPKKRFDRSDYVNRPRGPHRPLNTHRREYSPKRHSGSPGRFRRRGPSFSPSSPRGGVPYTTRPHGGALSKPYSKYTAPAQRYAPSSSFVYRDTRDRDEEQRRQREAERERERIEQAREKRHLEKEKREREIERRRLADQEERNRIAFQEIQKEKQRVQKEKEQLAILQEQILQAELKRQKEERERVIREQEEALRKKTELERLAASSQKRAYTDDYSRDRDYSRKKPAAEETRYYDPYVYDAKDDKTARRSPDRYHSSSGRDGYSRRDSGRERDRSAGESRREPDRHGRGSDTRHHLERQSERSNSGGRRDLIRPSSDGRRDRHKDHDLMESDKSSRRKYTPVREVPAPARNKDHSSAEWDDHKRRPDASRPTRVVPKSPPTHTSGSDGRQTLTMPPSALKPSSALRDTRTVRVYSTNDGGVSAGGQALLHEGSYGDTSDAWMRRTASYVSSNLPTLASTAAQSTSRKPPPPADLWGSDGRGQMRGSNDLPDRWVSGNGSTLASSSGNRSLGVALPAIVPPPPTIYLHPGGMMSANVSQYTDHRYDYKSSMHSSRRY